MLVCSIIADVILLISILIFENIIFKFDHKEERLNKNTFIIIVACVLGLLIGLNLGDNLEVTGVAYIILVCVLTYYFFQDKLITIIVSSLWTIAIMEMLDTMSVVLTDMLIGIIDNINSCIVILFRALILLSFVLIIGKLYNRNYSKGIKTIGVGNLIAFTALTIFDTFIVMVIGYIVTVENELVHQKSYFVALILVVVCLYIQLGAVILLLMQRNIYKESQQLTEKYLEEQKNHYEYLEKRETETKKFRHDLRSHMEMLSVLAKERRYDEFDKYVEEINLNIDRFGNNVTVQNGIVDAIINKYYSEAVANEVNMEVKGRFPSDCKIDAYHLCTIFSNILSNALEATVEAGKKWISVECRYTDDNILVVVKNTFDNKDTARNGKARTHKKDTNNHGFGLENVKDSIRKYNGLYVIDTNEDIYTITISFNYIRQE